MKFKCYILILFISFIFISSKNVSALSNISVDNFTSYYAYQQKYSSPVVNQSYAISPASSSFNFITYTNPYAFLYYTGYQASSVAPAGNKINAYTIVGQFTINMTNSNSIGINTSTFVGSLRYDGANVASATDTVNIVSVNNNKVTFRITSKVVLTGAANVSRVLMTIMAKNPTNPTQSPFDYFYGYDNGAMYSGYFNNYSLETVFSVDPTSSELANINAKMDKINNNLASLDSKMGDMISYQDKINKEQEKTNQNLDKMNKEQEKTNQNLDKIDNTLNDNDTSEASNQAGDFFNSFTTETYGLTDIITAPLNTIKSITSSTCSPLKLPMPFVNKDLTIPCIRDVFEEHFNPILLIYQVVTSGFIAYWIIVRFLNLIKDFKNPDHDEIEVLDL